jgi:outer membrane immunogenic protein
MILRSIGLRAVIVVLALAASPAAVLAADPAIEGLARTTPRTAAEWTGLFAGGNFGALWSHETRDTATPLTEVFSHSGTGWLGGTQVGYDYQFASNGLIGFEGAFSGVSLTRTSPSIVAPPSAYETDVDWLASLTARLGYVSGPWLVYGRGGYAATAVTFIGTTPGDFVSVGGPRNGWTLGGGVEYMIKRHFSVGLEYNHYEFGTQHYLGQSVNGAPLDANVSFRLDNVMLRANFRFGG